ncbi:zf-HC2 domain-containing protein [Corynebacterium callunae]|uniref:zf-HC2 domain-containing protein n=1 Tax=Corynebacterium callunae TaxID=1721 RepID=UPI0039826D66
MVDCSAIQAALSARLDGEPAGIPDEIIDAHLANCADCRNFYERAAQLNRMLNFSVTPTTPPDLSEIILAEVEPAWRRHANARVVWTILSRAAAVALAVLYLAWGINMLGEATSISIQEDPFSSRLIAEGAALRIGLAVGLGFAAWRPRLSAGLLPVFATMWTFSMGFAAQDLVSGRADFDTVSSLILLFISTAVLFIGWINTLDNGTLLRTWRSINATPA